MRRHHSLRASDAERDAVVDRLRDAAGDGRLEPDELEQRVDGALHARTHGDLAALLADLPNHGRVHLTAWRANSPGRSVAVGAGLLVAATVAVALVAVVAVVALAAALCWIAVVVLWRICSGSRRRLPHAHRARPTGFL